MLAGLCWGLVIVAAKPPGGLSVPGCPARRGPERPRRVRQALRLPVPSALTPLWPGPGGLTQCGGPGHVTPVTSAAYRGLPDLWVPCGDHCPELQEEHVTAW